VKITRWVAKMIGVSLVVGLLLVGISYLSLAELQRVYVIVNLDNAPVSIVEFGKYIREDDTHISSVVEYLNRSDRDIEALAITMIYYDAFNEREDGVKGTSFVRIRTSGQRGPLMVSRVSSRLQWRLFQQ